MSDDSLARSEYVIPTNRAMGAKLIPGERLDEPCTYLCGNSLGLLSNRSKRLVFEEFEVWGSRAVEGHFDHPHGREWMNIASKCTPLLAEIVGAKESEVACMSTLTANLHLMMNSFYKPTQERFKILCEARAFPSDQYAFASQALFHGLDPAVAVREISPREGEFTLRESDIMDVLDKEGPAIALVILSGVQYYTGQLFPIESITRKAKEQGCRCGWDLAHAVGNVPLSLHDWDVDFAVWCSYKYLNSGPGGIGGLFIHEKWDGKANPQLAGWWGHDPATRFAMPATFSAIPGAQGFQQSNPAVLPTASLIGSLEVFRKAGMMKPIRARSLILTADLEQRLHASKHFVSVDTFSSTEKLYAFTIISPTDPEARGAQLSLLFSSSEVMKAVFAGLTGEGVVGDRREPDVIRLAPAPLYSSLLDCKRASVALENAMDRLTL